MVIGYGNPLRRDDGLGLRAAEILEARGIDTLRCHQLTPELAAGIAKTEIVVFLDAAADLEPGEIRCAQVSEEVTGSWTHHLTPGQLLHLTAGIFASAPKALLITGGPFAMDFGDCLTAGGEQCARRMAEAALLALSGQLQPGGVQTLGHHA